MTPEELLLLIMIEQRDELAAVAAFIAGRPVSEDDPPELAAYRDTRAAGVAAQLAQLDSQIAALQP